jgi:hypothetical protein
MALGLGAGRPVRTRESLIRYAAAGVRLRPRFDWRGLWRARRERRLDDLHTDLSRALRIRGVHSAVDRRHQHRSGRGVPSSAVSPVGGHRGDCRPRPVLRHRPAAHGSAPQAAHRGTARWPAHLPHLCQVDRGPRSCSRGLAGLTQREAQGRRGSAPASPAGADRVTSGPAVVSRTASSVPRSAAVEAWSRWWPVN